ncbi:MAG: helix-turn-helix domain-containing protein [Planctomycetota bacterium]
MPKDKPVDPKQRSLRAHGTLHPRPGKIQDELFRSHAFFDPRDLLQVKYEMLRRVRIDGLSITGAAQQFSFSRPAFYKALQAFEREGLWGLLPAKRGPRRSHKLSAPVMEFLARRRQEDPSLKVADLRGMLQTEFGLQVHARSIERALARVGKKTP